MWLKWHRRLQEQPELRDINNWPQIDEEALDPKQRKIFHQPSFTEKPASGSSRDGPSKVGSMRLSRFRLVIPSLRRWRLEMRVALDSKCGDLRGH